MSDYIAELKAAFLKLHNCDADYIETVPVVEEWQGETIWEGDVEVFTIRGHPKATRGTGGDTRQATAAGDVTSPCCICPL